MNEIKKHIYQVVGLYNKLNATKYFPAGLSVLLLSVLSFSALVAQTNVTNTNHPGPYGVEVNTWNGNLYYELPILNLPTPGMDIDIRFSYNSKNSGSDFGFGNGWTMNYNIRSTVDGSNNVIIDRSDGQQDTYAFTGSRWASPQANFETLTQHLPGQYRLAAVDGTRYYFNSPVHGKVTSIKDRNNNVLTFTYNGSSELISISSSCGASISLAWSGGRLDQITESMAAPVRTYAFSYDGSANLVNYADPEGNLEMYAYDGNNRMTSMTNKNGQPLTITYNAFGSVETLASPLSFQGYTYDAATRTTTLTEALGAGMLTTNFIYNTNGQLTQKTGYCCGASVQYEYDGQGNVTRKIDANGNSTYYTYNNIGQLTAVTDALNNTITYNYNAPGMQMSSMTDKNGNVTDYLYDVSGNLIQKNYPEGVVEYFSYNPDGTRASYTDGNGNITTYTYDACGNRTAVNRPLGVTETYSYNTRGNLLSETDPNGCATTYTYDQLDRMLTLTDPMGGMKMFVYDPVGNLISETDKNNNNTFYTYDVLNRLLNTTNPLGISDTFVYNQKNLISSTDFNGNTTTYTYDGMNRLSSETDGAAIQKQYTYDLKGNRISFTNGNGNTFSFQYDAIDRLVKEIDPLTGEKNHTYDPNGNRINFSDENNNIHTHLYDGLNRLIQYTDPLNNSTTYTYDGNNNQTLITDGNLNSTIFTYDALNRLTIETDALGGQTFYTYDLGGNEIGVQDRNGNIISRSFDCLNRVLDFTNGAGDQTSYAYDLNGNPIAATFPNGNTYNSVYDPLDRLLQIDDISGTIEQYFYDNNGNTLSKVDGNANTTTYAYDGANRVTSISDPAGEVSTFAYDNNSNILTETDRENNTTGFTYDALDRRTKITDPLAGETLLAYNPTGTLSQITDANENTTQYAYDALNRLVSEQFADNTTRAYTYDAGGNRSSRTDNNNSVTTYTYDNLDRLVARDYPDSNDDNYTYDPGGRMLSASNNNAVVTMSYDPADRLLSESLNDQPTAYTYDVFNNKNTITYPNGRTIERFFNPRYLLDSIREASNVLASFTYDPGDRITQQSYLNGAITNNTYNANNWVTGLSHNNGSNFVDIGYNHDKEGNRLYVQYNHKTDFSEQYIYDNNYRLSDYKKGTLSGNTIPAPTTQSQFLMDAVGNRNSVNADGLITNYSVSNMNTYSQIAGTTTVNPQTDNNGNLTFDGTRNYTYDFENRLIGMEGDTLYYYDALGRRVRKIADGYVRNYYYSGKQVVMEQLENPGCPYVLNLTGEKSNLIKIYEAANFISSSEVLKDMSDIDYSAVDSILLGPGFEVELGTAFDAYIEGCLITDEVPEITTYVYGTWLEDILSMNKNGVDYFYHHNSLGSVVALTDAAGSIVERYEYDPYGKVIFYDGNFAPQTESSVDNPYLYTSRRLDSESGLYYYRARHYDPVSGRFMQRDPLGYIDGLNLYEYVGGNVTNWLDPLGTKIWIKGKDGKKYQYKEGKIYDEKGKEVKCPDDKVKKIRDALDDLRKNSPKMKKIIEQLEKSKNDHNIDNTSGGSFNRTTGTKENESNGKGTGSDTEYNPDGHGGFSPNSVLAHELQHAADKDSGKMDRTDKDKNGYPDSEDKAVDTANEYRKKKGESERDDYGDADADPKKTAYDRTKKFDPKAPYHPKNKK